MCLGAGTLSLPDILCVLSAVAALSTAAVCERGFQVSCSSWSCGTAPALTREPHPHPHPKDRPASRTPGHGHSVPSDGRGRWQGDVPLACCLVMGGGGFAECQPDRLPLSRL